MRENITFSVIIPIYNVEAFLKECIDSVLQQTYKDYEIILVDDGSTDESGAIADTYARNYPGINVIHRNNGGLSAARNTGIEAAKGRYIIFVDSDDYIDKNALLNFANCVVRYKEPDIIAAQAYSVNWDGNVKLKCKDHHHIEGILSGRAFWETAIKANEIFACAPFNAYKTSLIRCTHIYFLEGLLHEDQLWTPTIFWNAKSVVDGDFIFYYHRMRQGSITHSSGHEKKACDLISTCYSLEKMYREYPLSQSKWSRDCVAVLYDLHPLFGLCPLQRAVCYIAFQHTAGTICIVGDALLRQHRQPIIGFILQKQRARCVRDLPRPAGVRLAQ